MRPEIPKFDVFHKYIEYWASTMPNSTILRCGPKQINYKTLNDASDALAQSFLRYGVKKGDRIVTILPPSIEYVYTLVAASKIGGILVPMDVRYKAAELRNYLHHVKPKVIVAIDKTRENEKIGEVIKEVAGEIQDSVFISVGSLDFGLTFDDALSARREDELENAKRSVKEDDDLLIIFTGGTTGVPKATLISHKNVVNMCVWEDRMFRKYLEDAGYSGELKMLAALPPSHVGGTIEIFGTGLVAGSQLIILDHWSPYPVLEVTEKERLPFIGGVPTMFKILTSLPDINKYDLACVKFAFMSGEKVTLELLINIRDKLCRYAAIGYGSTEAGAEVTFTELLDLQDSKSLEKLANGYVGKPLPCVEIKIINEKGETLPPGEVGEIVVRGDLTSRGYFKQPKENQENFTSDGYHKTGDMGFIASDGSLYIIGRRKHIIRVGSYTVLPQEVEDVVMKNPKVALAGAIGVPHEIYGEVVWLVVVPKPGCEVKEEEIIEACKKELADFKVPRKVLMAESIPITRIGKVDRSKLREEIIKRLRDEASKVRL